MLHARHIKGKALRRYWEHGDDSKINPKWREKIGRILNALDVAAGPGELNFPGFGLHELTGNRRGTYSIWISRNWRVTFKWGDDGPTDVDMEDYHGR